MNNRDIYSYQVLIAKLLNIKGNIAAHFDLIKDSRSRIKNNKDDYKNTLLDSDLCFFEGCLESTYKDLDYLDNILESNITCVIHLFSLELFMINRELVEELEVFLNELYLLYFEDEFTN